MPKYRVAISLEEGVVVEVEAVNAEEAEAEAYALADDMGGTDYPKQYRPNTVHREFWTQDVEEVKS
jgi:hypothetical protein